MVTDKNIHRAFRTHVQLYKQNPLEEFFFFYDLPKLYIGFNYIYLQVFYLREQEMRQKYLKVKVPSRRYFFLQNIVMLIV